MGVDSFPFDWCRLDRRSVWRLLPPQWWLQATETEAVVTWNKTQLMALLGMLDLFVNLWLPCCGSLGLSTSFCSRWIRRYRTRILISVRFLGLLPTFQLFSFCSFREHPAWRQVTWWWRLQSFSTSRGVFSSQRRFQRTCSWVDILLCDLLPVTTSSCRLPLEPFWANLLEHGALLVEEELLGNQEKLNFEIYCQLNHRKTFA